MAKSIQEEAWDWVALHSDWESGHDLRALVIRLADRIDELERAQGMAGFTLTHARTFTTDETQDNEDQR